MNHSIGQNCIIGSNVVIKDNVIIGNNVKIEDNVIIGKLPNKSIISNTIKNIEYKNTIISDNVIIGANSIVYIGSTIGSSVLIADLATVRENVVIGEKTIIGRGVAIENNCIIGKKCKFQNNAHIAAYSEIGDYVFIGPGVTTTNDNFIGRDPERVNHYKGITIRCGGRVGAQCVLLPGLIIGEDSLVGAGSLLTKNVPPGEVWFGSPAKYVKNIPSTQKLENQDFYEY